VWDGDAELVATLLAAGANPAARDHSGTTPVHLAGQRRSQRVRDLLERALAEAGRTRAPAGEPGDIGDPGAVSTLAQHHLSIDPRGGDGGRGPGAVTVAGHAALVAWSLDLNGQLRPTVVAPLPPHQVIVGVAIHPHGRLVALACRNAPVELRARARLDRAEPLAGLTGATALAFSPDGRWLALADASERVLVVATATRQVVSQAEGGERTAALAFSPAGTLLAAGCSFQGGAHVRIDRVGPDGPLEPLHAVDRSTSQTPPERFVDALPSLAFSPDGRRLAVWQTSAIYHADRPAGWRGDVVMLDPATGRVLWERSIDAEATGNRMALEAAGFSMGYDTSLCVTGDGGLVAVGVDGRVVLLDAGTGGVRRVLEAPGAVNAVRSDPASAGLIVATDRGLHRLQLPPPAAPKRPG